MMRLGTLFSGIGGVEYGAMWAGLTPVWAVEYDTDIATWYRVLHPDVRLYERDVLTVDADTLPDIDALHASPPCPSFSIANAQRGETPLDIALAEQTAQIIRAKQPYLFTLEQVPGYQKSRSYRIICDALANLDYWVDSQVLNAADYGVPQTRQRLIIRAVSGGFMQVYCPMPPKQQWRGWYEALLPVLNTLPESEFAAWQMKRLPAELKTLLIDGCNAGQEWGKKSRKPTGTGILVDGTPAGNGGRVTVRDMTQPSATVTSSAAKHPARASLTGRVVALTPQALAMLQSFPMDMWIPEEKGLACRGIGNAVPPLLAQAFFISLCKDFQT